MNFTLPYKLIPIIVVVLLVLFFVFLKFVQKRFSIQKKILQLHLERKMKEISKKNEILEKNNLIQSKLISIISHDIITPLKFIHFTGKSLIDNQNVISDALQEEMIVEISKTAKELELLSTNILNWIKFQNENRRLVKEELDLYVIINQIFNIFNGLSKQKGIELRNEFQQGIILFQYFEPVKIVLYNLILNALNFTEHGAITISGGKSGKGMLIKVKDNGSGMTKEQIENIMSDSYIVSTSTIDKKKGNGLGYLIIKDMLKLVNAKFVIKSKKDKGTMVSILIPM